EIFLVFPHLDPRWGSEEDWRSWSSCIWSSQTPAVELGVGKKEADIVGRMISLLFHDFIMVVTCNPQGGFVAPSLQAKTRWESELVKRLHALQSKIGWSGKPIIWGGDFNVNPYPDDWTTGAWEHLRHKLGDQIPAGCREEDVEMYNQVAQTFEGVNWWEIF